MPEPGTTPVPENTEPAAEAKPEAPAAPPAKTFSEDDVNRIVQERLVRQKAQYVDYDDLKEKASKFDEFQKEQMSELEKATERAEGLERDLAAAEAAKQDSLLRAAVISEAAKRNVIDPDAALALVDRSLLEYGEDGSPTNIADAMESLLEAKPYLVGGGPTRGSADLGARGSKSPELTRDDLKKMSPAEIVKAQSDGRLDSLLGVSKP